jgi:hypothetical protein
MAPMLPTAFGCLAIPHRETIRCPLNAIRAFEATARHGSFTAAASELCVTVTAITSRSRRRKLLVDGVSSKADPKPRRAYLPVLPEVRRPAKYGEGSYSPAAPPDDVSRPEVG